ncbi:MAG: phosphodiester glycosidase family protein [Lachnospira sp.]|uniref:Phosphodiester glycosidase family protein n=1 Tax=Lachnospira hominis (ex Liu et al. 2021) TaxID=2763051 RepID=A0ABR7FYS9_9FIRM|nr:phosphodiester glycosidase family protein [Lachnospira hominis]MBO6174437.1 phosphodiester glycosidase family protein [Lachnospira sp.]
MADVTVSDVSFLRAGLANGVFGRNIKETTSDIAKENNAIFAINGDFYGFRDSGPVIRNGVLYRSNKRSGSNDVLAVYNDGSFVTMKEENVDAQNLLDSGVLQLFSFGPTLVDNGQISVSANQEVEQSMNSNPRTAIGMISPLHYVFVVSDGRTSESAGLSLAQLAAVMQDAGCQCAYNLDGGGSSTMWFMGDVVNNPTTNGNSISERKVSDIVYIGQ